jgi:hypothetical protein
VWRLAHLLRPDAAAVEAVLVDFAAHYLSRALFEQSSYRRFFFGDDAYQGTPKAWQLWMRFLRAHGDGFCVASWPSGVIAKGAELLLGRFEAQEGSEGKVELLQGCEGRGGEAATPGIGEGGGPRVERGAGALDQRPGAPVRDAESGALDTPHAIQLDELPCSPA